jgi:MoxR-like ATPase
MPQGKLKVEQFRDDVYEIITSINQIMFGVDRVTKFILISIICNDHILLEDVPGTGKTMLTNTISKILDLEFKRIQGTPDLLPSDLTGVNIYSQKDESFHFVEGPIFTNMLLFDEINRASPKTQSSLLEAMAEGQVSVDNKTYTLDKPFFVIATQNPLEHLGTYPLPQAQLDRFLIKTKIGYPERQDEARIMLTNEEDIQKTQLPDLSKDTIFKWQSEYKQTHIDDDVVNKLLDIIEKTRDKTIFKLGISPRSSRKLIRALKASAYIHGRDFVSKDDIHDLFVPIMAHRIYAVNKGEEEVLLKDLVLKARF